MERWKKIRGFPGYEISSEGRVLGLYGRVLRQKTKRDDSRVVGLYIKRGEKKVQKWAYVGRIVLTAFKGTHPKKNIARHINGDASDNRLVNLEWSTRSENANAGVKRGTIKSGENSPLSKLTNAMVNDIRTMSKDASIGSLSKAYGVSRKTITDVIHYRRFQNV